MYKRRRDSYAKITIPTRDRINAENMTQQTTVTCSCSRDFTLQKEWGDDVTTMQIDLGKIYASSPIHVNMSMCFDQYKIEKVKLTFVDRGYFEANETAKVIHPIFFTVIDRSGSLDGFVSLRTVRSYANYKESVMPNNLSLSPVQTRAFNYNSPGWCDTKGACKLPKLLMGFYDTTFMYQQFAKTISVRMTCQVTYKGVRRDLNPVMGTFYGAQNEIQNVGF